MQAYGAQTDGWTRQEDEYVSVCVCVCVRARHVYYIRLVYHDGLSPVEAHRQLLSGILYVGSCCHAQQLITSSSSEMQTNRVRPRRLEFILTPEIRLGQLWGRHIISKSVDLGGVTIRTVIPDSSNLSQAYSSSIIYS